MAAAPVPLKIEDAFSVADKVVIVTGAVGIIGPGIAETFAVNRARVVCSDRPSPKLEALAQRLRDQGCQAAAIAADLNKPEELHRLVEATVQQFGGLDVLVNCGGIPMSSRLADEGPEDFDRLYHTNVRSQWLLAKYAIAPMSARGGGSIVNIASINGHRAAAFCSLYTGTKAAVLAMTRELAVELAPQFIRVNSVSPGWIADPALRLRAVLTALREPYRSELGQEFAHLEEKSPTTNAQPLRMAGSKYDVAMACLYLSSPAARFVTGEDILVDGGRLHEMPHEEARFHQQTESPWAPLRNKLQALPDSAWEGPRPRWARPSRA